MDFSALLTTEGLVALLTLTFLEIILGIDNIVFISIVSNKLKPKDRPKSRTIGLILAGVFRIVLLFGITWVLQLQKAIFSVHNSFLEGHYTGQAIILFVGGMFLLYKSVSEIHHKLEGYEEGNESKSNVTLTSVIMQITVLNVVFSFDSILTAIGLTKEIIIMIAAIIISIVIMVAFASPVSKFVNNHPTIQILGLSFLILIGFLLIAEGAHLSHMKMFGMSIGAIPKGYLYFAIFFSLFVEFLNLRVRKKNKVKLKNTEELEEISKEGLQ